MNNLFLLSFGGFFMIVLLVSGMMLLRQSKQQERYAQRVRLVHGQAPAGTGFKAPAEPEAIRVAIMRAIAGLGQVILRSGVLSASTRTELEHTLAASGLHGANGLAAYIGVKLLLLCGLPCMAWLSLHNSGTAGNADDAGAACRGRSRAYGTGLGAGPPAPGLPGPARRWPAGRTGHAGDLRAGGPRRSGRRSCAWRPSCRPHIGRWRRSWRRPPTSCRWSLTPASP